MNHPKWNIAGKMARTFIESKLTLLLVGALVLAGVLSILATPREYNPQITVPAANIMVSKPGANPEEVHNSIVKPLEALLNALPGVEHTFGYAQQDFGMVTVQFKVGEDQERSLVRVYNQIMQNMEKLPNGASQPMIKPVNVDDVPILSVTLSSAEKTENEIREVATGVLEQLRNIPGVSVSEVLGAAPRGIQVWLDPIRMQNMGISLDQIDPLFKASNLDLPLGELVNFGKNQPVRFGGRLASADEVGSLVIAVKNGKPISLSQIAKIEDGPLENEVHARIGFYQREEQAAITITLAKKAGTNAVHVASDVLKRLDEIQEQALPEGIALTVTRNDGAKANEAVNTLIEHMGIAVASVVFILIVFLGWREASIVILTVPLILFIVFTVGYFTGQTINRITLFALILALGLLVDDSIVVIENIHRHMHSGKHRNFKDLIIIATNEIGSPTNVATIAVVLAFLPMAFVTGMMGPFMRPIPINVPVAMLASLLVAYAVVPWAARIWLSRSHKSQEVLVQTESMEEQGAHPQDFLHRLYVKVFTPFMTSPMRRIALYGFVLAALGGAMLQPMWQFLRPASLGSLSDPLSSLGVELKMLPYDNTNTFLIEVNAPEGSAAADVDRQVRELGLILSQNQMIENYQSYLGVAAPLDFAAVVRGDMIRKGENFAQIRVNLIDKSKRSQSSHQIAQQVNASLQNVQKNYPQTIFKLYESPPGPPVQSQIIAELYGSDLGVLQQTAPKVQQMFKSTYGIINTDVSLIHPHMNYQISVDHLLAAQVGVTPAQIAQLLNHYLSGTSLGTIHAPEAREAIPIVVRLPQALRTDPHHLLDLTLTSSTGSVIPLSAVARLDSSWAPQPITTRDQHPMVRVSAELLQSSPVYAVLGMDQQLDQQSLGPNFKAPTGNLGFTETPAQDLHGQHILWGGEMRLTLDVFRDMGSAFLVALVFIYLLLVAYYKDFTLPWLVMGAIPLTLIGVFPGHWITNQAFTATSMIGVIALAGIVVRNSLLLIDFILDYRAQGHDLATSVIQAGAARFRPIVLTALAIILGSAIMLTDPVFGGLAVSLIFGTFASTILTLIVIPLVYFLWQKKKV